MDSWQLKNIILFYIGWLFSQPVRRGTTISDYLDRTLHLGFSIQGSAILLSLLLLIFLIWYVSKISFNVNNIRSLKGESLYWTAILISNTLGTALGDLLATEVQGWVFREARFLISVVMGYAYSSLSFYLTLESSYILDGFYPDPSVGCDFWGLTVTKTKEHGGFDFGTINSFFCAYGLF